MATREQELRDALEQNAANVEALMQLERLLTEEERWDDLVTDLEKHVAGLIDPIQQARFLTRSSFVARSELSDPVTANVLASGVLNLGLEPDDLITAIQLAFIPDDDWNGLLDELGHMLERTDRHDVRARLLHAIGRTHEERLHDRTKAIIEYQRAFKTDPVFLEPLHAARALYAHADQWETVAKLYNVELQIITEPKTQARLLKELGAIQLDRLGEPTLAAGSLRRAMELDPDLAGIQEVLARIDGDGASQPPPVPEDLATTPGAVEPASDGYDEIGARAATAAFAEPEGSMDFRDDEVVLAEKPKHGQTPDDAPDIEQVPDAAPPVEETVELSLDDVAQESSIPPEREEGIAPPPFKPETAEDETAEDEAAEDETAEDEVAEDETAEDETAEDETAEDETAEDETAEDEVAEDEVAEDEVAEDETAEDEVAEDEAVAAESDEEETDESAASASPDEEESVDSSIEELETSEIEEIAPDDPAPETDAAPPPLPSRRRTGRSAEERMLELAERIEELEGAALTRAVRRAAPLARQTDWDVESFARWVLDAVRTNDDGVATIRRVLPALYGWDEAWTAVAAALEEAYDEGGGSTVGSALYAVHLYGSRDPDSAEKYARDAGEIAERDAAALEFATKGNWRKTMLELQDRFATELDEDQAEIEAYREQAYLALGLDNEPKATDSLRRLLKKTIEDEPARALIKVLYRASEKWNALADILKKETAALDMEDAEEAVPLLEEMIALYSDQLRNPAMVVKTYQQWLEIEPENIDAIDALAGELEEMKRYPDLVKLLRQKADVVDDPVQKVEILGEVADLFLERFSNQAEAIRAYEQILEIDPDHRAALQNLEEMYERRRDWSSLIDVKARRAELAESGEEQIALRRELAEIATTRLRDTEMATARWNDVLALDPADEVALEALSQLYERNREWSSLAEVLSQQADVVESDDERAKILSKLGDIQLTRLEELEQAVGTYERLLAITPDDARAKEALKKAYIELQAWDELEGFFARDDAWPDYASLLETLAGTFKDTSSQVELLFRAARVWQGPADEPERAVRDWERILRTEEDNAAAANELAPVYRERGDARKLAEVLEIGIATEEGEADQVERLLELAELYASQLRDAGTAFERYARVIRERLDALDGERRAPVLDAFEETAEQAGRWDEAESVYRAALAGTDRGDGAAWTTVALRTARVVDAELDRPEDALPLYQEILEQDPESERALDALDDIFVRLERWEELLEILDRKLDLAEEQAERIAILERICRVNEDELGDVTAAIGRHVEIVEIDPTYRPSLDALHRLYAETGEYEALAGVLRRLIETASAEERSAFRVELATVLAREIGAFGEAVDELEQVVSEEPSHDGARALLAELQDREGVRHRVARIREPLFEADEDHARLVDVLEIQLESEDDPTRRRETLGRIGRLHAEQLGAPTAAIAAYSRLLREDASSDEATARLESLAEQSGAWEEICALYESRIDELSMGDDDDRARAIWFGDRVARFHDEKLGSPGDAIRVHRRILEFAPERARTLEALDELLARQQRFEELLDVIERRIALAEQDEEAVELRFRAADVWRHRLGEPEEAITQLRMILGVRDDSPRALAALDDLLGETGQFLDQAQIIEQRIEVASAESPAQHELKNRLASLYESEMGDLRRALELWSDVLESDPRNAAALSALERQLASQDSAMQASKTLEPLYEQQGDWDGLIRSLSVRLEHTDIPAERRDLYHRIAGLYAERREDAHAAFAVWERAVQEQLDDEETVQAYIDAGRVVDRIDRVADRLEELAEGHDDPSVTRAMYIRIAEIRRTALADIAGATRLWREVYEMDPSDRRAVDALEGLYEELEAWKPLVEILHQKAELPDLLEDIGTRKRLLFRAARIFEERLGEPDEAIEVLRLVLEIDPVDTHAIDELERIYTEARRWEDLVENYERKIELTDDVEDRRELYTALAAVLERELEDPDRAIGAYRAILDLSPEDLAALQALDRLYEQTENWHELLDVLKRESELVESREQARNLRFRIGRLFETRLLSPEDALTEYAAILSEDPRHVSTRMALGEMIERGDAAMRAAELLLPLARDEGDWDRVVELERRRVEATDDPARRRELLVEIARILESELDRTGAAFDAYGAALREWPVTDDVAAAERLADALGRWEELAELYTEIWDDVTEPALRSDVGLRLARVYEDELGQIEDAIRAYERVHEENLDNLRALRSLERLYASAARWEELAEILEKETMTEALASERTELQLRLADVRYRRLDDPIEAVNVYRELLAANPENDAARVALEEIVRGGHEVDEVGMILEPLYREQGRWAELISLDRIRIEHEESETERRRFWVDISDIQVEQLAEPDAAIGSLGQALREVPSDPSLRERIDELAAANDLWQNAADAYRAALESTDLGDAERYELLVRLAEALDERLGDIESAEQVWRAALSAEPGSPKALAALDRIYESQGRAAELADVLERRREVVYEQDEMVALAFRLARLYERELGREEEAIQAYHEVLDLDPGHEDAIRSLEGLYAAREDWESLYDIYERRAMQASDDARRVEVYRQMARLVTERLGRPQDAIDIWNQVLAVQPESSDALHALAALYEQTEQYLELTQILERQAHAAESAFDRAALLRRLAHVQTEQLDDEIGAIATYQRVLDLSEQDPDALSALETLYDRTGQQEKLAEILEEELAAGLIEEERNADVHARLGTLYADVLGKSDDAIRCWRVVLDAVPGHDGALDRLEALYRETGRWDDCVAILERKVERADDLEDKVYLLREIASIHQAQRNDPEGSADAYRRIVELDPDDRDAVLALEEGYRELERWGDLVSLYLDQAPRLDDRWEQLETLRKAAEIYEERLEQPEGAFLIQVKALEIDPLHEQVQRDVERLAELSGSWSDYVSHMVDAISQVAAESGEDETLPLQVAVARAYDAKLDRPEMAEIYYEKALSIDPENEESLAAVERIYEEGEDWESLVGVLKRRANLTYEPGESSALFKKIGRIQRDALEDDGEAVESYKMALRFDDRDAETLDALEALHTTRGEWRELVEVLNQKTLLVEDPAETIELKFRAGTIWAEQLGIAERAIDAFGDVLAISPDHRPTMLALEQIYEAEERWDRYLDILEAQLAHELTTEERIEIFHKRAVVFEEHFDDIDRAVGALHNILEEEEQHTPAILELERIYREQERWPELIDVLDRHAAIVEDEASKIEVLMRLAHVYEEHLIEPLRAIETYRRVLELDDAHAEALGSLVSLYESTADWGNAAEMTERLARALQDPDRTVELLRRAGEIHEEKLDDLDAAEQRYQAAFDVDPGSIPTIESLRRVFAARGDWESVIQLLRHQIEYSRELGDRANLLAEIGEIFDGKLEDPAQARQNFEEAVEFDPTNVRAAMPLADMYAESEQWERAHPLFEMLLERSEQDWDDEHRYALHYNYALASERLEMQELALEHYAAAREAAPAEFAPLRALARLEWAREELEPAREHYRALLDEHGGQFDDAELVEMYYRAGELERRVGDLEEARRLLEAAIEHDPVHVPALKSLLTVVDELGDRPATIEIKQQLVQTTDDDTERLRLVVEIGDALAEDGDVDGAVEAYRHAVELKQDSKVVLHKLLNLFTANKRWQRAVEVLAQLANLEDEPQRYAKLCYTIGVVFRDELGEASQAVRHFNMCLDANPDQLEAFQAIDQILTAEKDWAELERAYRKMIQRVAERHDDDVRELKTQLFQNLGKIYQKRLMQPEDAVAAYRLASQMAPENESLHEVLADLYERIGGKLGEAAREHHKLIEIDPLRVTSYHSLFRIYMEAREYDRAWCVAAALTRLQNAKPEEQELYRRYLPKTWQPPRRALTSEHWQKLSHPDMDPLITALFGRLAQYVRGAYAYDVKATWGLHKRKDRYDLEEQTPLAKMINLNARLQGVPVPQVYRKDDQVGVRNANLDPPGLLVGSDMHSVSTKPERELAFQIARWTALLRKEFYMAAVFPTENLKLFFFGAVALTTGQTPPGVDEQELFAVVETMQEQIPAPDLQQIQGTVQKFLETGRQVNLSKWRNAVAYTSNRLGLLLAGDLGAAVKCVKDEPHPIAKVSVKDKIRDLILFTVSEEHFELRRELGLAIGGQ